MIKKDSTIRLCGDYKVTVNQAANTEVYPLPRMEEICAYQQVLLDDDSKKYTTINTHKSSQITFIYIAPLTIQIVTKYLFITVWHLALAQLLLFSSGLWKI